MTEKIVIVEAPTFQLPLSGSRAYAYIVIESTGQVGFQLPLSGSLQFYARSRCRCECHKTFNSLSRDHLGYFGIDVAEGFLNLSTPSLGITGDRQYRQFGYNTAFNSLSRDHRRHLHVAAHVGYTMNLSTPSLGITEPEYCRQPLGHYFCFQLPLSGSRAAFARRTRDHTKAFNSLSRDHLQYLAGRNEF